MDFFDKIRTTLSPLRQVPNLQDLPLKTWTLPSHSFTESNIRLLLYRDCDRRGRKCLYDSHHVIRDKNGKFSYIPSGSLAAVKRLGECILGCVPLCSNNSTKRFFRFDDGKFVWSKVFCPRRRGREQSGDSSKSGSELTSSTSSDAAAESSDLSKSATNNISLPNITVQSAGKFKTSSSLPSRLELGHQKTLLGLAIVIQNCGSNKDTGSYLQSMSKSFEESSDWFAAVASKAYCKPNSFVQTLFDFSQELTRMIHARLTTPLISTVSLPPSWRTLPSLTPELVNLLLRLDSCLCKASERIKLVIVGSSSSKKVCQEAKALLYLFKLLLLKCKVEEEVGVDAAASYCDISKSAPAVPSPLAVGAVQQFNFVVTEPKLENEKYQKKEYDSGIDMSFSSASIKSMRKSVSQNFDSSDSCSGFSSDEGFEGRIKPTSRVHEFEEVSFHLGEFETDAHQSVKTLGLGEVNLAKLKIHLSSVSYFEPVESKIEKLSLEPMEVKLDFGNEAPVLSTYCQYCDSVANVEKFSPLYYIQWLKSGITEEDFNLMRNFNSKFVIVNLDKSFIRTVNFEFYPTKCNLVDNLVQGINIRTSTGREAEIEQFLSNQIEAIKNIAQEFTSLQTSCDFSIARKHFSHLSDNDFDLINFLAKMKFPYLNSLADFV